MPLQPRGQKPPAAGALFQANQRQLTKLRRGDGHTLQITKAGRACHKNLANGAHGIDLHPWLTLGDRVGDGGKIDLPRLQLPQRLRRGAVGHVDLNAGIGLVKSLQMIQHKEFQRQVRGADAHPTFFQTGDLPHILLAPA